MRRKRNFVGRWTSAAVALLTAACSRAPAQPEYQLDQCRRVALQDSRSGGRIVGAEDLAIDPVRGRLLLSAFDRRAVAKAVSTGALSVPEGGLYGVSLADVARDDGDRLVAARLVDADAYPGGLRPHGLAYLPQSDEVAFVNKGYRRSGDGWARDTNVVRVSARDGAALSSSSAHCAANDVTGDISGLVFTFDHASCGWRASLEDALLLRRSGVGVGNGPALFDRAAYANGIVGLDDGVIAVAATREKAIVVLSGEGTLRETKRIALPGGPDNLTLSDDGIVAAVHPSILRLAVSSKLGLGAAPSRVLKVDPATGAAVLLFEDRTGRLFSGATVAVERGDMLIVGSATDEGLLVCEKDPTRQS